MVNWTEGKIEQAIQILQSCDTVKEAAEHLNTTTSALRKAFARNGKLNPSEYLKISQEPEDYGYYEVTKGYIYVDESDTYLVQLPMDEGGWMSVDGDTHRAMKQDYSAWPETGPAATINQVSQKYGWPKKRFEQYKKMFGWTHGQDWLTKEEHNKYTLEEKLFDASLKEKDAFERFNQKRRIQALERDAQKWRMLVGNIGESFNEDHINILCGEFDMFIDKYRKDPIPPRDIVFFEVESEFCFAACPMPTDLHYGVYASKYETGMEMNRAITRELLIDTTQELIEDVLLYGNPEITYFPVGSDWFHVDSSLLATTKGTRQDTDGTFADIFFEGCDLAVQAVDMWRAVSKHVELVLMLGNHDYHTGLALLKFLSAHYKDCSDVTVTITSEHRQYRKFGNNLLGWSHGDKAKPAAFYKNMSNEASAWWSKCDHKAFFVGHLHHEVFDFDSLRIFQAPSLECHTKWSKDMGYASNAGQSCYIFEWDRGYKAALFAGIEGE